MDFHPKNIFISDYQGSQPFIIYVPGLTGDSADINSQQFALTMHKTTGYNIVIYNRRGNAGVPFKRNRYVTWSNFDDFDDLIAYLHDELKAKYVFLAGISMGANFILNYAGNKGLKGEKVRANAIFALSSPYNLIEATANINANFITRKALTKLMQDRFKEHLHEEEYLSTIRSMGISIGKLNLGLNYCLTFL
jgi:predicted alpha/beta-fold hydrolase